MSDKVHVALSAAQDSNLSWGAKGVLLFLASLSPEELATDRDLLSRIAGPSDGGKTFLLLLELNEAGYLRVKPDADPNGAFSEMIELHVRTPNTEATNA